MPKKIRQLVISICIAVSLCLLAPLCPATAAPGSDEDAPEPVYDLSAFLGEMNLTFDEYIETVKTFEENGTRTYYLEEKAAGYAWYQQNNPQIPEDAAIAYVNIRSDFGAYSRIENAQNIDSPAVLVNKNYILPETYEPADLVNAQGYSYRLREQAADRYAEMKAALNDAGYNLYIMSAFRSYSTQKNLHRNAIYRTNIAGADEEVAREGHSEHQTGLAVDVLHRYHSGRLSNANFQDTEEYLWLKANAHKYGFILRYPEEHTDIHGYMYEPWHWRYVGVEIATAMYAQKIAVYEEFYGKYLTEEVLLNTKELILAERARVEAEAKAEAERKAAEQAAAEEAEEARKAAEEAALVAEQASPEAEEAERKAAEQAAAEAQETKRAAESQSARSAPSVLNKLFDNIIIAAAIITVLSAVVTILESISLYKEKRT